MVGGIHASIVHVLENLASADGELENLILHFGGAVKAVALGFLPFFLAMVATAFGVGLVQVGFLFSATPLEPSFERLDPIAGLGRIFSMRSVARLMGGLFKVTAVALVVGWTVWHERLRLLEMSELGFEGVVAAAVELMLTLSLRAAMLLLVLAILEYGYQKWQYERDLRMSKQEIREELKRFEGDPRIRERRRAIQRQLALQRMMQKVPKATVVITNPTHYAVAIQYDKETMDAPVVVAKGTELLAKRIREIAMENGIPIIERRELAQALYKSVEVDQVIPPELYQAVAEILAYVYRIRGTTAAA